MNSFTKPTVAFHGSTDPKAPLVVLLHGRGSHEQEIISLAPRLPEGVTYAAVRAPISEGGGFAWFANRGIGRPVAESLSETMVWFREWLDEVAPPGRPVVVVGFSGGAAFAGGLVLSDPARYAGAAILYGTLPFDAGVPVNPSQLAQTPVFVAQGDDDQVIPRELLDRTWSYLLTESGAPVEAHRDPGGHGITAGTLHRLAGWLNARLSYLADNPSAPDIGDEPTAWGDLAGGSLPERSGPRPEVSWDIPQQQLSDNAPSELQELLFARLAALPEVASGPSQISVPGARGLTLPQGHGPAAAYLVPEAREFAHLHPGYDGSLHLALPQHLAADVVAKGWGTPHPWSGSRLTAGFTLVFGPRDAAELEVVEGIVGASYAYAAGADTPGFAVTPTEAQALLRSTRKAGDLVDPFTDTHADLDEEWGYATQDLDRAQRLEAGETIAGAKLGLTSRAKRERMGVDRPIVGFLTQPMLVESSEVAARLSSWVQPRIEPEIAFITSRDISHPVSLEDAPRYVESVLMAAEIIDSHYTGSRFGLPDVVADNTSAAGVVLAPERHHLGDVPDLATLRCEVRIDEQLVHEATGAAILGAPLESLVLLSRHLARHQQILPAGSLVLAGALTDASPLQPGHRYDLSIDSLGRLSILV